MNRLTCLWPLAVLACAPGLPAQTADQTPPAQPAPAPAPSPWSLGGIDFSGYVDAYYNFNSNHPASGNNNLRFYDAKANTLSLSMAKFTAEHAADPVGFKLDLGFGRAADLYNSFEPTLNNRTVHEPPPHTTTFTLTPWG